MLSEKEMASPRSLTETEDQLSGADKAIYDKMLAMGQGHLFLNWPPPGENDLGKRAFFAQVVKPEHTYTNCAVTGQSSSSSWSPTTLAA